jgi:hypothetical protein
LKLAEGLIEAGRLDEADAVGTEAVAAIARIGSSNSYDKFFCDTVMGELRHAQGRHREAIPLRRESLALLIKIYGEGHIEATEARILLASTLIALGDDASQAEAKALLETARTSLEHSDDEGREVLLGKLYVERAELGLATGNRAGARADIGEAMRHLQAPSAASTLRRAKTLGRKLDLRT